MNTTYRPNEDQNVWNFIFSVFFVLVLVGVLYAIYLERGGFPTSVSVFDAVLMALASFRITRLVVYDKITRFFREWFVKKILVVNEAGEAVVEIRTIGRGVRHTIYDLLQCPWCIGMWSSLIICGAYFLFPWAWFVILFLALAGAGSFVQILANLIGWKAEGLKQGVEGRE
ncbi:MAG: hypothetical protein JWO43_53 [Candidatus Adlerbacteria bacterium]|nr:hypothetical protein [Candidatus Adlerbacteria bacterium]